MALILNSVPEASLSLTGRHDDYDFKFIFHHPVTQINKNADWHKIPVGREVF
jgi:hypothetical protein